MYVARSLRVWGNNDFIIHPGPEVVVQSRTVGIVVCWRRQRVRLMRALGLSLEG